MSSDDPDLVEARWRMAEREVPDAAFGVGKKLTEFEVVLDVDPRNFEAGSDSFEAEVEKRGELPATVVSVSGRGDGGKHYHFQLPEGVDPRTEESTLAPGVQLLFRGHNVVLPPSTHPSNGRPYTWEASPDDVEIAVLPHAWLPVELRGRGRAPAARSAPGPSRRRVPGATPDPGRDLERARRALAALSDKRSDDYESWVQVGMAAHSVSDDLFEEWVSFSRKSDKFDRRTCEAKWRSFRDERARTLGLGSLIQWAHEDEEEASFVWATDVTLEEVNWLWKDHLAFGKLNGLVGDMDKGKGVIAVNLAARLSTGTKMPDGTPGPEGPRPTLFLSVEDAMADTIVPRFLAAGGDPKRLATRKIVKRDGADEPLSLPDHMETVRRDIKRMEERCGGRAGLIVLDPFNGFLSDSINSWNAKEIRRALSPIAQLAEETGWAILSIGHLNKSKGTNALHRVADSHAYVAAMRIAWLVGLDPADEDKRVMVPMKRNLLPPGVSGLGFVIESKRLAELDERLGTSTNTVPVAAWRGERDVSPAEVLEGRGLDKTGQAGVWLYDYLSARENNEAPVQEIMRAAGEAGHAWSTVKNASTDFVEKEKLRDEDGKIRRGVWRLLTETEF
jgi:hypothetical protein